MDRRTGRPSTVPTPSLRALATLVCLLTAAGGCTPAGPPFPAGTVHIQGEVLSLAAPPGIEASVPSDDAERARWATAWRQQPDDPLAPWAGARLELLSARPVAPTAVSLLEGVHVDDAQRCARDADLVLARWLADRPAAAIGLQGCAGQTDAGRRALTAVLEANGLLAVGVPEKASAETDPRTLFRRGPPLLLTIWDAPTPTERDAAIEELRTLSERHAALFAVPAALDWWQPLVELTDDDPRARAVRELLSIPTAAPSSQAEALERGERLAAVAAAAGDAGHGLIAVRALHLRGWALESPASTRSVWPPPPSSRQTLRRRSGSIWS